MKSTLKFLIVICFIGCIFSCAKNEQAHESVFRGIYEGAKQMQEMRSEDGAPAADKESPTYDQYQRERQEILNDQKSE